MDCNTPGFPVLHHLLEFAQTHVHWVSDAIQASHPVVPFSSCPQFFPTSGYFPMSQLFASGGQRIGASASVLPMNIRGWFPLGWTGWISLQSKRLSRIFSNTTTQKHQFFGVQPSSWSNSHSRACSLPNTWLPGTALVDVGCCYPRFPKVLHVGALRGGGHSKVGWGQHDDRTT